MNLQTLLQTLKRALSQSAVLTLLAAVVIALITTSCSQEKTGPVAMAWHNVNSKYNAWWLAREKMKEVETTIYQGNQDNYNRILDVFPPITKTTETSITPMLTEALKKASIPIQQHKKSDWVDDCYLIVGQTRYYKTEDYDNAVYTFKYNFSKSKDPHIKQASVIWLMRTFLKGDQMNDAFIADDWLRQQEMRSDNLLHYYEVKAWYHQKKKELKEVAFNLEKAVDLMLWPTDKKARYHFIIAQIRQRMGQDSLAFVQYNKAINCFPPYEMDFFAKTNIGQVTSVTNQKDIQKVNNYFKKLLKDEKNKEYLDKVYYEMARFELKLGNVPKSIELFQKAVKNGGTNPNIKAYSYLRLGEVHYERLKKFDIAKAYYDSTITILDTLEENYPAILKRQKNLEEFIKHYVVVEREDSLLRMAALDSNALYAKIDKMIADKEKKEELEAKAAKKAEREKKRMEEAGQDTVFSRSGPGFSAGGGASGGGGQGGWYFFNQQALATGREAFVRKWGNRPLEDNWRRKSKEKLLAEEEAPAASSKPTQDSTNAGKGGPDGAIASKDGKPKDGAEAPKEKKKQSPQEKRAPYLKDLPFTDEAKLKAHEKLKVGLFELGKVYDYRLEEYPNAIKSFKRVVAEYNDYEKVPEAMYYLYIIHGKINDEAGREVWKNRLINEHPESLYAKLILNPNYLAEMRVINQEAEELYSLAYQQYEAERFVEATQNLNALEQRYPENDFKDKVALLKILLIGKTVDYDTYKAELIGFQEAYPKSPLKKFAGELVTIAENFRKKQQKLDSIAGKGGVVTKQDSAAILAGPKKTNYIRNFDSPHIFVVVLPVGKASEYEVKLKLSQFNREVFPDQTFNVEDQLLGDDKNFFVRVREFKSRIAALSYLKRMREDSSPLKEYKKFSPTMFVITQDNFRSLYRSKNIEEYMHFFNAHYDMSEL